MAEHEAARDSMATGNEEPVIGAWASGRLLPLLTAVLVGIAAILLAWHVNSLTVDRVSGPDDSMYASQAARLLHGRPLTTMSDEPAAVRPPGYVIALAGGTVATGTWEQAESVVGVASLVVAVVAAGIIGWSLAGSLGAIFSLAIFLVPGVVDAFARSAIDGLQAALVLSAIAIAHAGPARAGRWRVLGAVAVGVLLGLAILTKETALALAPWPLLWAATQPSPALRPAIRWGGIASAALVVTILPWWIWVDLTVGTLFPTHIAGVRADLGVAALAAVGASCLLLAFGPIGGRASGLVDRLSERRRWWLAVLFAGLWALVIVASFLASDARHALAQLPSWLEVFDALSRLIGLLLVPVAAIVVAVVATVLSERRSLLRGLVLLLLLTGGLVVIIVAKGWDSRSALVAAIAMGLLVATSTALALRRLARTRAPTRRVVATAGLAVAIIATFAFNVVGLAVAAGRPPVPAESNRWNGPVVQGAADWLSEHLEPGDTIVSSWLFASSLDAMTDARYRIVETPTLQARIGRLLEPILVPTGTLFRENAHLPRDLPDDWLFVRRHPTEGYLVALSGQMLAKTILSSGARYLVLTGEHVPQSTATIAEDLLDWPGVQEVARFERNDAEIVILEIDPATFGIGPFETHVTQGFLRDWPSLVRPVRRGTDMGGALCQLLGQRTLAVFPDDDRAQELIAERLPIGCPLPPVDPSQPVPS